MEAYSGLQLPKMQAHYPAVEKMRYRRASEHSDLGFPLAPRRPVHLWTRDREVKHLEEFRGLRAAQYPWVALRDGRLSRLCLAVQPVNLLPRLVKTTLNCFLIRIYLLTAAALDSLEIPDSSMRKN